VVFNCGNCIVSRERMLTCRGNKSSEKNEVAALPNSHIKGSMNEARQ